MKKISFTILDDYMITEFLEQFGINADHEIIRVIEPILATDLDLDNESVYSFIENLRFDILGDLNYEIQCLGKTVLAENLGVMFSRIFLLKKHSYGASRK
jgi:hypothetical protein